MAGYGQLGRRVSTSIGSFFSPDARQAGEMAGLQQIALAEQIEQGRAKAAAAAQEAELKSPRSIIARTLMGQGIGPENAPEVGDWLNTGRIDRFDAGGQAGPTMPQPDWYKPETRTRIGQHFAGAQAVQAGEAKSLEDYFQGQTAGNLQTAIAKALASGDVVQLAQLQNKDPVKQVQSLIASSLQSGEIDPATGGRRMAATEGKPLFTANEFGSTDLFTGGVDASGAPAQAFNRYRDAATGAQKANAAQSYASADSSRASAEKSRQERELGAKGTYDSDRGVIVDTRTGQARPVTVGGAPLAPKSGKGGGKLPAAALKMQQEEVDAINTADAVDQALAVVDKRITDGKLKLGPVANIVSRGQNAAGASTENSKNFASLQSSLEKLRNDTLRLNKGVQTEGDAARAWNELVTSLNDPELVRQRIAEIRQINTRAKTLRQNNIDLIRSNYGADAYDHEARVGGATGEWKIERLP
jgi:hypothetical protein